MTSTVYKYGLKMYAYIFTTQNSAFNIDACKQLIDKLLDN